MKVLNGDINLFSLDISYFLQWATFQNGFPSLFRTESSVRLFFCPRRFPCPTVCLPCKPLFLGFRDVFDILDALRCRFSSLELFLLGFGNFLAFFLAVPFKSERPGFAERSSCRGDCMRLGK